MRAEIGAEMHRALQRQHREVARLDAQMAEHRLIRGLLLAARDCDVHVVDAQQRHRAEVHARSRR